MSAFLFFQASDVLIRSEVEKQFFLEEVVCPMVRSSVSCA